MLRRKALKYRECTKQGFENTVTFPVKSTIIKIEIKYSRNEGTNKTIKYSSHLFWKTILSALYCVLSFNMFSMCKFFLN